MGGEWYFRMKKSAQPSPAQSAQSGPSSHNENPLDVKEYHNVLLQLKTQYEGQFTYEQVMWCDSFPPVDNVFVRFEFSCELPQNGNKPLSHWFRLYWNPSTQDDEAYGNLHGCCFGLGEFNYQALFEIQSKIVEKFPNNFVLHRELDNLPISHSKLAGDRYHNYKKYVYNYYDSDSLDSDYDYCDYWLPSD